MNLYRCGAFSSFLLASVYISAFIFFGLYWDYPSSASAAEKFVFLAKHQITYSLINLILYVVFGIFLSFLVLALHERLKINSPALSQVAAVFGIIWVALVIASGMIANIGLSTVLEVANHNTEQASIIWQTITSIVEGIGGGNEIVGGLWVLFLTVAAYQEKQLTQKLNYLGFFVGLAGIATIYPAEILTEAFGLSQILWFIWLGIIMLKTESLAN